MFEEKHNLSWLQIPDDLYRILIMAGLWSGRTNSFFNLRRYQPDIDKINLYTEDP